ncbi:ABC-three component system protein [Mucilaginibacter aquatilis]|uniref:ABC-three component systems C-terminal domain-containing protein n=1 Tax=Mucilaginibacter aquatilis TaxID=1517760 RepID=A0A6I4IAR8_9SPHI|nr:ABC-three component system protein [Mucilaginibacter aquatilis]MVN92037.1 hypothetical protein [Mucilaginibacter aquatilis]
MIEQANNGAGNQYAALRDINIVEQSAKITSNFSEIINILGEQLGVNDSADSLPSSPFSPEDKISYNNVTTYKEIIDEFKVFVGKLSMIYNEYDKQGLNTTANTLLNIKLTYLKIKSKLLKENPSKNAIDVIRENADGIFLEVENQLFNEIKNSSNITASRDVINISLQVIMIDAFMRCKILEEPIKHVAS